MAVDVRPMRPEDKAEIMKILRNTPEFTAEEVTVAEELINLFLQQGAVSGYRVMVSEGSEAPTGYICFGPTPMTENTWDIYWMAVAAERQGQGIGRALIEAAEAAIKKDRGRLSMIETSSKPNYEKTRAFHVARGYELIATIPDFYAPGDDKLIYRKLLKTSGME